MLSIVGGDTLSFRDHSFAIDLNMEDIEIDIFYIEIETLSAYDLIEFLTINNKSHEVRCASFEALQKRARQFASKGPEDKVGIPYYLYRYETNPPTKNGRDWRISPT